MKRSIEEAHDRIAPHVVRTPCRLSPSLSEMVGGEVYLKLENLQDSGSFKLRGVINKIQSIPNGERRKLLVTASTGNHGAAFAHALSLFGLRGRLFMATTTTPVKVDHLRSTGVPFELVGSDPIEAEVRAAEYSRAKGGVWISPYNDPDVINGQGTIGVELMDQLESFDLAMAPVGGGGLIAGIAGYLKAVDPSIEVIGCQPVNSCVMYESVKAGEILDLESLPTISDGTAGGIDPDSMTLDLCRQLVDDFILLEEDEIIAAMRLLHESEGLTIEGAAALTTAAVLKNGERFAGKRTVLIVSGGRVDESVMEKVLRAD